MKSSDILARTLWPLCFVAAPYVFADSLPPIQELVGSWVDKPVLNHQAGEIVIRLGDARGG